MNDQAHFSDARPPEFSEESLALGFAELHHKDLRYVDLWGKWYFWDAKRWAVDDTLKVLDLSRVICRRASAECNKSAKQIASAKTVYAVVNLARSDRRLAATVRQWDVDPWLLNTPTGTVDLRTGKMRPHAPGDLPRARSDFGSAFWNAGVAPDGGYHLRSQHF